MAEKGYGCEFGDCVSQPNHLITTMNPGATVSLCDEHYPAGLIPLLAAELGVEPMGFYQHVEKYLAREKRKADAEVAAEQAAAAADGTADGPDGTVVPEDTGADGPLWDPDDAEQLLEDPPDGTPTPDEAAPAPNQRPRAGYKRRP
jgi:hypothetical protein